MDMEAFKKQTLLKSWQSTTYQQAIWRAKRRLVGKQEGDISDLELKLIEENLQSESKPDYSRWIDSDVISKRKQRNLSNVPKQLVYDEKDLAIMQEYGIHDTFRPRSAAIEFLSVVDQVPIHHSSSHESTVDLSTSYDDFGLCAGCFHKKGPHYHYHTPVRIGGGYSIYRRPHVVAHPNYHSEINWSTIKWLADLGKEKELNGSRQYSGFGDDYSAKLFDQYISRGGDPEALQEYLDSNFSQDVLEELEASGVNVDLLQKYTELYRKHIKVLLQENIEKQSKIVEEQGKALNYAIMYATMENDGADMKMLVTLLRKGRNCKEFMKFENEGGNTEILEHFAQLIYEDASREIVISEFEKFQRKSEQHYTAQIFTDFLNSGGDVRTLKACFKKDKTNDALPTLSQTKVDLLDECINKFKTNDDFLTELRVFLQSHLHLYQGAELLQEFIENGGNIQSLKQFVDTGCNVYVGEQDSNEKDKKFALLNKVGRSFLKSPVLRRTLEEFPEEPQLLEVYLHQGGDFLLLVKAISLITQSPHLEDFVQREAKHVAKKLIRNHQQQSSNIDVSVERAGNVFSNNAKPLPSLLLPRILDKAQADLVFNQLIDSESNMKQNEGVYLSKSMDLQNFVNTPATSSVDLSERNQVIQIYRSFASQASSSSSAPSKRKKKLWIPPKPFEVEGSSRSLTYPKSPFSHRRAYDISSLTEDRIMNPAKQQRNQLDALKRNIKIKEFQKNWKVSITSPRGSIISADSQTEIDHSPVLNEVITKLAEKKQKEAAPVDKKSRRQRQRDKMRAAKKSTAPVASRKQAETSTSSNLLPVPNDQSTKTHSFPSLVRKEEEPKLPQARYVRKSKNRPASPVEVTVTEPVDPNNDIAEKEDLESDPKPQQVENIPPSPEIRKITVLVNSKRDFKEQSISPRYATAFGPKMLTSSYSNFLSAKTMRNMRDNPETLVGSLHHHHEKLMSKSESNLTNLNRHLIAEERLSRAYLRKRQSVPKFESVTLGTENIDYQPEDDLIDLLKKYCIIREERLHAYKRVFEKYVLMKSIRDREKALETRSNQNKINEAGDEHIEDNTLEGQLRKNEKLLESLRENITEVRLQIAAAKDEVNKAMARIAYRKMGTAISALKPDEDDNALTPQKVVSIESKQELLYELTADERRICESDVEVRDRKVVLAHLRAKVKSLLRREKGLLETSKRLVKLIQAEALEKSFQKRERAEFTRKQSRLYQELHPIKDDVMDPSDLSSALKDLDKGLTFFDRSYLTEEISRSKGVRFQVFCVVAALLETKNVYQTEPSNLNTKMNVCKEYYSTLLGPNIDALQIELEAAGIAKKQRDAVVKKLSRGDANEKKLDFLDFVAYSPLFLSAHSKIIANPLAS